jgi:tight adherence protein B
MNTTYAILGTIFMAASVATLGMFLGPAWDEFTDRYINDLRPRLKALGISESKVHDMMRLWGIGLVAILFIGGVLLGKIILAVGVFLFVVSLPRIILDIIIERRRIKIRDQLVSATVGLANTTRAGLTLAQGFESIAPEVPEPLGTEFRRIVRSFNGGQPLAHSIREVKNRLDLEAFSVFASAILVALEQGGQISIALDKISAGLAEFQRLEQKMEATSAGGKRLALVLALFPPGFLVGFYLLDPSSVALMFELVIGQIILLVIGFVVFVATRWSTYILDIEI